MAAVCGVEGGHGAVDNRQGFPPFRMFPMKSSHGRISTPLAAVLVLALLAGAWWGWSRFRPAGLPEGMASGNGRIEATEIDVATRSGGRLLEVLVREGDDVQAGQVVARMDTASLQANLDRAHAQVVQAQGALRTADAQIRLRQQGVATARAQVAQHEAEVKFATRQLQRTQELVDRGFLSPQKLDEAQVQVRSARAALQATQSQVAEARAAVEAARAQRAEGDANLAAARAHEASMAADMADGTLKAPTAGRVQVRVAQPGEVLAPGGKVLSLADLTDVSMTFFLPEAVAGRLALGSEVRIVLDAAPRVYVPARVSFVASAAQFTPKTVETASERQKMMFRVRARIDRPLLERWRDQVKTGLPGVAYVITQPGVSWPQWLDQPLSMERLAPQPLAASR